MCRDALMCRLRVRRAYPVAVFFTGQKLCSADFGSVTGVAWRRTSVIAILGVLGVVQLVPLRNRNVGNPLLEPLHFLRVLVPVDTMPSLYVALSAAAMPADFSFVGMHFHLTTQIVL